jgi:hypothetical protein
MAIVFKPAIELNRLLELLTWNAASRTRRRSSSLWVWPSSAVLTNALKAVNAWLRARYQNNVHYEFAKRQFARCRKTNSVDMILGRPSPPSSHLFVDGIPLTGDTLSNCQRKLGLHSAAHIHLRRCHRPQHRVWKHAGSSHCGSHCKSERSHRARTTGVHIAHRLTTIGDYGVIHLLDRGAVAASGRFQVLKRDCSWLRIASGA